MASAIFRYSANIMSLTELEFGRRKSSLVLFSLLKDRNASQMDVRWPFWECHSTAAPDACQPGLEFTLGEMFVSKEVFFKKQRKHRPYSVLIATH